tara:strand:+ start:727 stop:936 length:210 start_codon:yes stop_codon:yes gene_type:complete
MTKDDIMKLARKAGLYTHKDVQSEILTFAKLVAEAEREACAKLVDAYRPPLERNYCELIARLIRARGTT